MYIVGRYTRPVVCNLIRARVAGYVYSYEYILVYEYTLPKNFENNVRVATCDTPKQCFSTPSHLHRDEYIIMYNSEKISS